MTKRQKDRLFKNLSSFTKMPFLSKDQKIPDCERRPASPSFLVQEHGLKVLANFDRVGYIVPTEYARTHTTVRSYLVGSHGHKESEILQWNNCHFLTKNMSF